MKIKSQGNDAYNCGDLSDAVNLYSRAITAYHSNKHSHGDKSLTPHQVAILYSNRAEALLQAQDYSQAFEDAKKCVEYNNSWFKVSSEMLCLKLLRLSSHLKCPCLEILVC